jgi:tetratricopeptide (TPR) repeat protein
MRRTFFGVFVMLACACGAARAQGADFQHSQQLNRDGLAEMRKGNYDAAVRDFTLAINASTLPQATAGLHLNRAQARQKKGDLKGALEDINTSLTLLPGNVYAYVNRAALLREMGDAEGAVKDYTRAVKANSKFPVAYLYRGLTLVSLGRDAEAQKDFDKFVKLEPGQKESMEKLLKEERDKRAAKQ